MIIVTKCECVRQKIIAFVFARLFPHLILMKSLFTSVLNGAAIVWNLHFENRSRAAPTKKLSKLMLVSVLDDVSLTKQDMLRI